MFYVYLIAAMRNNLELVIMIERKTMLISPVQLMNFRANGETRSPLKDVIDPPMPKKWVQKNLV